MSAPGSSSPRSLGLQPAVWLSFALLAASINACLGLLLSDFGVNALPDFLLTFAATLVLLLAMQGLLWLIHSAYKGIRRGAANEFNSLWTASAILIPALLLPALSFLPGTIGAQEILVGVLSILGALGLSIAASWLLRQFLMANRQAALRMLVLVPLTAMLILLGIWLFKVKVELVDNESGLPTLQAISTFLFLLTLMGLSYLLGRFAVSRLGPGLSILILTLGALVIPIGLAVWILRPSPGSTAVQQRVGDVDHVVLITVDTLRADSVGRMDRGEPATPRLDALLNESVVFTQARSPSPWTKPAMASIMTGLPPLVHGATTRRSSVPDEVTTLAEILEESGYLTAAIGRNGSLSAGFNFDQGFDEFRIYPGGDVSGNPALGASLLRHLGLVMTNPSTLELADMVARWVDEHSDTPFFLWVHFFDPHAPYAPPKEYLPRGEAPPRIGGYYRSNGEIRSGFLVLDDREKAWVKELYDAEVRLVDQGVGRVIDSLERNGILEDALVVFSSDHGEEFFEHGLAGHGHTLFDEVLRVPLAIKLPGSSRTGRRDAAVSTEAIAATVLEIVGSGETARPSHAAESLSRIWQGDGESAAESPVISTAFLYFQDEIGVVFDDWKFIDRNGASPDSLFALGEDPDEWNSLTSARPDKVEEAKRILDAYEQWVQISRQELGLSSGEEMELSPELEEDLRALGYIQ